MLLVLPWVVGEGTRGAVDEVKPFLDEGPPLQGGKKGGISLQLREARNDCGRLCLGEIRESLCCIGKRLQISED